MVIRTYADRLVMSRAAARHATRALDGAIDAAGTARVTAATGASQLDFLEALTASSGIEWSRVELFHLDEYIGLPIDHPASFRRYLLDRLIDRVGITRYHLLDGEWDVPRVIEQVGGKITKEPIHVAFVGIGENGHLAFNDPPADFDTEQPYLVVNLNDACRRQQVGEGWFASVDDVPKQAISMSVRQILKAEEIICVVPDARKVRAVAACFEGAIGPMAPASILRTHPNTTIYLDRESAALLAPATRGEILA